MLERIPINCIFPRDGGRLRRLDPANVKRLAGSIAEIGLQSPISVRAIPCKPGGPAPWSHNGNDYLLVTGEHRLEACRTMGWTEIPAVVVDLSDMDRELWEIDENLMRAELTELERADHLQMRKILYLKKHPETANGGDRGNQHRGGKSRQNDNLSFCQDTAEKTGLDRRSIERSVHRAEAIAPSVKEAVRDVPEISDSGVELDALAAMEPAEQKAAVEAVKSGKARNVREATQCAKPRKPKRRIRPAARDEEIVRREMASAAKQCQKKITRRLIAVEVKCDGNAIDVAVTFQQ